MTKLNPKKVKGLAQRYTSMEQETGLEWESRSQDAKSSLCFNSDHPKRDAEPEWEVTAGSPLMLMLTQGQYKMVTKQE